MTQRAVNYTYGTGNPVLPNGSIDVRDGIDNLQSMDVFMNAPEDTYNQRDGGIVKTVNGMNNEFNSMIQSQETEFEHHIAGMAFTRVGTFFGGETLHDAREVLLWDVANGGDGREYGWTGAFPKVVTASSSPLTTGGIGAGAWVDRTDVTLRSELAANGGASLVGPGVMTRGVDKFSIMQGRSGEHRKDTLTRGLAIELNEPITGSGYAGATNTYMFNRLLIAYDKVDAVNDGTPGSKVDGLIVQHGFGGPGTRGGRHAAEFMLTQNGMTEADNTDRNYVGVVGYCATNTGDGGTSDTDKKGAYFGGNFFTTIKNAPFVGHANGCESNVLIDANSSVYYRAGYSAVSGGEKQATKYDAAYAIGALGVNGAQWRDGILVGVQNGRQPISRAIIRNESALTKSILSFSGNIPPEIVVSDTDDRFNFKVDRLEMYYTNAALSLGSKTASNTPAINAYTDASGNMAGRIIFSGDASTNGNGVCNIQFRQTTVKELVPSSPNAFTCGTASLPWSGMFTQTAPTITSDERMKTAPLAITDAMLDAAAEVDWVRYQYIDRVEAKGPDGARWHFGAVAQRFVEAFSRHGLDAHDYGFLCYDEWESSPEVVNTIPAVLGENGEIIEPERTEVVQAAVESGSRYGIRYEEALVLEAALQRRNYQRLLARIEALEVK